MELTQKILKELLHYDPNTGVFVWKVRDVKWFAHCKNPGRACNVWNARFSKTDAGGVYDACTKAEHLFNTKYIQIRVTLSGETIRVDAHRLAFLYMRGILPHVHVDHIDHNGLNNSWNNLRDVSNVENSKNQRMRSNNTSGFTGVVWHKNHEKWQVQLSITDSDKNRKCMYGGQFENIDDAIEKRKLMNVDHGFHKNHGSNI